MYILGIETTGAFASAALVQDGKTAGHIAGHDRFSHLQNLMPQVQSLLESCGAGTGDIDAIAVSCGPGSFTGIRIGVSSARALAQILDIQCVPVSSLEALAERCAPDAGSGVLVCPMLDARRSQIYGGGYMLSGGIPQEKIKAGPYMLDEFLEAASEYEHIIAAGDAVDRYRSGILEIRPEGIEFAPEAVRYQDAVTVAHAGYRKYLQQGGVHYEALKPDYMRIPEAERKLRMKQRKG